MRTTLSALLVILALLLGAVAGPALWLQRNVVDQAGFVALAGPLGANKAFQEGITSLLATQTTASLNMPSQLNDLAGAVINSAARNLYTDPGYPAAWAETLQRSHQLTFAAAGNEVIEGDVMLDVAPLVGLIAANVGADLGVTLPVPADVVIGVEQPKAASLLPMLTLLGGWSGWLVFIAVDLLVLGIIVARQRGTTLVLAGVGLAVVALVWLLASNLVQTVLAGLAVGPEVAQQVGVELGTLARESWRGGINATFGIAAVVAVAGVATLVVKRRRTT